MPTEPLIAGAADKSGRTEFDTAVEGGTASQGHLL